MRISDWSSDVCSSDLLNALSGKPLPIYGDGMQIRDWLHVEDHCLGVALVLEGDAIGECFNIGGGAELPNLTVIETLCAAVDDAFARDPALAARFRSDERRVGKECVSTCRSGGSRYH